MSRALLLFIAVVAGAAWAHDGGVAPGALDGGSVVPPVLTQASPAKYPQAFETQGVEGQVTLQLLISPTGEVTETKVLSSSAPEFEASALAAAPGLRFSPALVNGVPTAVLLEYQYRFAAPVREVVDAGPAVPLAVIAGQVKTKGTPNAVAGAFIEIDPGRDGGLTAETDGEGRFVVSVPAGRHSLKVSATSHTSKTFWENVGVGTKLEVVYRVEQAFSTPYETVVRGQQDRAEVSRITLSGPELREVAGTGGEPLRVIMLLPGVASMGSGLSYPVVRGSVPAATGFYIDGIRVPQLFHLLAGPAVVHPAFIDQIDFYPANAPVRFGNITGGVVSASSTPPRKSLHLEGYVDLINAGAYAEVPIEKTGTNITVSGRVSYTGWLLAGLARAFDPTGNTQPVVDFYDYQARVDQKVGAGSLRLLAFGSSDLVGARNKQVDTTSPFLTSVFHRVDVRYRVPLGPGTFETGATIGVEDLGIYTEKNSKRDSSFLLNRFLLSGRAQYSIPLREDLLLRFAGDIERQRSGVTFQLTSMNDQGPTKVPPANGVFSGLSAELGWSPGTLSLVGGVRLASFHAQTGVQRWALEPRVNVRWGFAPDWVLKGGVGLFHQPPTLLINLPISDVAGLKEGLQETLQTSIGVEHKLPFGIEASAEVFFNPMFSVLEKSLQQFINGSATYSDRHPPLYGQSYGLELMVRSPAKGRFFGWVSYSLMRSERLRTFPVFGAGFDDVTIKTAYVPFAFDQTHTLNLVAGYQLPHGIKVSGTLHVNSGRPESGETSSRAAQVVEVDGQPSWRPISLDAVTRLPPFVRVDARISKAWTWDESSLEFYLDVFNASISQEVLAYQYTLVRLPTGDFLPGKTPFSVPVILPTIGVKGAW